MQVLHGKALSFNNLLDINGALEAIKMCNGQLFGYQAQS